MQIGITQYAQVSHFDTKAGERVSHNRAVAAKLCELADKFDVRAPPGSRRQTFRQLIFKISDVRVSRMSRQGIAFRAGCGRARQQVRNQPFGLPHVKPVSQDALGSKSLVFLTSQAENYLGVPNRKSSLAQVN